MTRQNSPKHYVLRVLRDHYVWSSQKYARRRCKAGALFFKPYITPIQIEQRCTTLPKITISLEKIMISKSPNLEIKLYNNQCKHNRQICRIFFAPRLTCIRSIKFCELRRAKKETRKEWFGNIITF